MSGDDCNDCLISEGEALSNSRHTDSEAMGYTPREIWIA